MDERKEYAAVSFDGAGFAEIEIEAPGIHSTAGEAVLRFYSSVTPAQPIEQRAADPVRQRFFDLRSLASGRPFARNDSELFYKQAKFMEDYTDNYEGNASFFMYFPYYQHMGYEQLRTYFTWRAKARNGEILPVSVSYMFLYVYELLSGIGVTDPADGLKKLMAVWSSITENNRELEGYLPRWLKDYHIYYELPHSFEEFVTEYNLQKHYSLMLAIDANTDNNLELWNGISSYDIAKSRFYNDGNEKLMQDSFEAVICGIRGFCESHEASLEDLLIYRVSNKTPWYPFRQALFYNWMDQPDRNVRMPGQERYFCNSNKWTASLPIYYSTQKEFAGYIIKKTESCLRQIVKYKHKLATDLKVAGYSFRELKDMSLSLTDLDAVIEKSVSEFHWNLTRTVVTVDHANLARIREESWGTQEKLVVDEYDVSVVNAESGGTDKVICEFDDRPILSSWDTSFQIFAPDTDDSWVAFKDALTPVELKALSIALQECTGLKMYADENGIMLEVLADSINEKAADYIGDNILEISDGMMIYDEYRDNIAEMVSY